MSKSAKSLSRRSFLKHSALTAAALGVSRWTAQSYARIVGANDEIRIAVVGCNDMGRSQIKQILGLSGVRLVALCDPDSDVLDRDMRMIATSATTHPSPSEIGQFSDVRKLLERDDIDAISTATPNHWHALITTWACQAGKDVYCEKPTCHNIWEGRQALAASRKYNRIVQAGTQWRSFAPVYETLQWVKAGNLGKILVSRGFCYKRRPSIGKTDGPQKIPASVDYDLWCGPAPKDPLRRTKLHYDWHWVWQTGNGDIGNQGAHQMDLARWALDKTTVAPSVISVGGRFGYSDDGQTPNTLMAVHDYGDALLIFEVRGLPTKTGAGNQMDKYKGTDVGNVIECEGGYATMTQTSGQPLCLAYDNSGKQIRTFTGEGVQRDRQHMGNFLKAMRSRRREDQNGEYAEGHVSSSMCHLSNISYLVGAQADPDAIRAAIKSQPAASETFDRFQAHLDANGVKLDVDKAQLGVPLRVDPVPQMIRNNEAACAMLTREYRAPFTVPPMES